jgi:uncharacterized membrane protein
MARSSSLSPWIRRLQDLLFSVTMYRAVRCALAGVFIVSGALKLADPAGFAAVVREYGLAPAGTSGWVALILPALEVLAGLGLLVNARGSLAAITAMLALFIFVLWYGILKDLHIDCGCFGTEDLAEQDSLRRAFHRDLWMLAGAGYLYIARVRRTGLRPASLPMLYTKLTTKGESP